MIDYRADNREEGGIMALTALVCGGLENSFKVVGWSAPVFSAL
jgi:K+ transporter